MIQKGTVVHACVSRFGNELIDSKNSEPLREVEPLEIPTQFLFNSSWKVEFACLSCDDFVEVEHDFDENHDSFTLIDQLDTTNYSRSFLESVNALFESIELLEVEGNYLLQHTAFEHLHNLQQQSSVALTHQTCPTCAADYLGLIREKLPLSQEQGSQPQPATVGTVEIPAILFIECQDGFTSHCSKHACKP